MRVSQSETPTNSTLKAGKRIFRIRPDEAERKAQAFGDSRLAEILGAMERDGLVVLEDVVNPGHVEKLGARMRADMDEVRARRPIGEESSNESLPPPLHHPWLFRDICYNEFAIQVAHAILGDGLYWNFYSSNTVHPRETRKQNIHHDARPLFHGETEQPLPAHTLVVNIPLTDFTEANGATEVWLGSHRETRRLEVGGDGYEEMLAEHRKRDQIVQATAKKGSLIIRDMRLYHGGMPNRTDELRQMIAMVYNRHFYRVLCWMPFARGTEEFFGHPVLQALCTFFDAEEVGTDFIHERQRKGLPELAQVPGVVCGGART